MRSLYGGDKAFHRASLSIPGAHGCPGRHSLQYHSPSSRNAGLIVKMATERSGIMVELTGFWV